MATTLEMPAAAATTKATISLDHLRQALKIIEPALAGKTTIPVLHSVRMEQLPEGLAVHATDLEIAIRALIPENTELDRVLLISSDRFLSWVKLLAGEVVKISANAARASVSCGRSKSAIPTYGAGAGPSYQPFNLSEGEAQAIKLAQADLARLFKFGGFAMGDESRFALNQALLVGNGKTLRIVTTDGHRLAIYDMASRVEVNQLLPKRFIRAVQSVLNDEGDITIKSTPASQLAEIAADIPVFIQCVKSASSFPAYEKAIPASHDVAISFSAAEMYGALGRCLSMGDRSTNALALRFSADEILIHSSDAQAGESDEVISATGGPETPITIRLNGKYVVDGLKPLDGDAEILLSRAPQSALTIRATPKPDELYQYVIMPLANKGGN